MIFDTKVHGIPCQCEVTHYRSYKPAFIEGPPENAEPAIPSEFEYNILDKRGRRALWLEKYLTPADNDRLLNEFQLEVRAEDYNNHY
jgi:hypothetical protein